MLVGLRVLGETNWGPISALSNMMQGIFGVIAPGNIAQHGGQRHDRHDRRRSEALMQDYKAGHMIGSTPHYMTIMQLLGTPIGAAAVSWMYPLLRDTYGIVGENAGLTLADLAQWAGFAEILSQGFERAAARRRRRADHRVDSRHPAHGARGTQDRSGCRRRPAWASACSCPPR